jgi:tetratricopeptide (TPR) repeat protein
MTQRRIVALLIATSVAVSSIRTRAAPPDQRGRELYEEGARHYASGEYDAAIRLFSEAYEVTHAPALLFNIAQSYRLKKPPDCGRALRYYERAIADNPSTDNRAEIEERIDEMKRCVARERATVAPPPSERASSAAPNSRGSEGRNAAGRSAVPLWVTAAGALVGVSGGALYVAARIKFDSVQSTCPCAPDSFEGWETATTLSYGLMALGLVGVGTGVALWAVQRPRRDASRSAMRWVVSARNLSLRGTF